MAVDVVGRGWMPVLRQASAWRFTVPEFVAQLRPIERAAGGICGVKGGFRGSLRIPAASGRTTLLSSASSVRSARIGYLGSLSGNAFSAFKTAAGPSLDTHRRLPTSRSCSSLSTSTTSAPKTDNMADREILPDAFKPAHYGLTITDLDFTKWTYQGSVEISGELVKPTKTFTLNTLEIKLLKAKLSVDHTKGNQSEESTNFGFVAKKQQSSITFDNEAQVSRKAVLTLEFEGILNHDMAGFYRAQYKPPVAAAEGVPRDAEFHYMFATQFEACDARRAFPCFDEPNLKATFDFAIEIPADLVALSNMPVKEETKAATAGRKLVVFERTPVMSTYLLAWAVGDFEHIEALTERRYNGKQLPVRVYTTRGIVEQGRWALQHAPKYIDFFSDKFGLDYPLPKSDILAVHEFTMGAMENWGLVTYRPTAILFDEGKSQQMMRNRIAYVVAHELAHQWFGNLVTMDWWDELWLNEGFATWAGWLATEALHPEWEVWAQFVNEGMETGLTRDAVRASHPIQAPVRDALDVNQIFDAISYMKGCSVIRMLASYLGVDVFLKGVSMYLKKHQYQNAKTTALFDALSEASGQDINSMMGPWIEKIGHPVLSVSEEAGKVSIRQSRFLSTGDAKEEDDTTMWWVPLALQGKTGAQGITTASLTQKEKVLSDLSDDFYQLNANATGFYRINYPEARLAKFATQLDRLSTEDKIAMASSAAALAFSGDGTTAALLSFIEGFGKETHFRVLSQALDSLGTIKDIFADDEQIHNGLEAFTLKLIEGPLAALGWDFPEGEDFNKTLLRRRLILSAGANGHEGVVAEATARFGRYCKDPDAHPIQADLRMPVFRIVVKTGAPNAVEVIKNEWTTTTTPDGKDVALVALSQATDPGVITGTLLPLLFGTGADSVPPSDIHVLASGLAGNRVARPLLWAHMQGNWDDITGKLAGNPVVLDRFVRMSLWQFADRGALAGIDAFFDGKDTAAFNRTLETVKDNIRGRAAYRERDAKVLKEWLVSNGYA